MSQSWPPEEPWPPRRDQQQSPYEPSNPDYPNAGYDYPDTGRGRSNPGYGYPPPHQSWQQEQPGGWGNVEDSGWSQAPTSRPQYQNPQYPQYQQNLQQAQYQQYQQQSPQYQQDQQDQQDQYGSPYGPRYGYEEPRRSRNVLLPVLLVVVLLLVVGGGAYVLTQRGAHSNGTPLASQVTTSATGTPGIPQGFHAYADNAAHVRFGIPQGWTTTGSASGPDTTSGLEVMSPDQNSFMLVKQYNVAGNTVGAANGALAGAAGSSQLTNKQGPTNVKFAGETWVQVSGDATPSGTPIHMVILVTTHKGASYLIGFFAVKSSFDSANTRDFQPMQNSFGFTN